MGYASPMHRLRVSRRICSVLAVVALAACERDSPPTQDPESTPIPSAAAAASAALEAARQAAAAKATRQVVKRPKDAAELILTPPRRAKLEAAYPQAKDFLDQSAIEQELFGKPLKRGANDAAVAAFDRLAKGRYVLFTGNIMSPAADGFELAVRYTPREATDPMGLTATWFPVRFQNVKGYDQAQYRGGEPTAILAKYEGKQQTSAAADVILLEQWDFATP